jgi:FKBP-type peptidyl-prolyl cis-trans isomerase SlpA
MVAREKSHGLQPEEPLKVRKNRRVTLHYRVSLMSGEEFDASSPDSPLQFICGRGETIPGLEKRIIGLEAGDEKEFVVPPEEAFGARDDSLLRVVSRQDLPSDLEVEVGRTVPCRDKGTEVLVRIVALHEHTVVGDFNHPLAGQPLRYQVTIIDVDEPLADPLFA